MHNIPPINPELEIISNRTFDISREKLFSMRSNPEYISKRRWPQWFTNTFSEFNFINNGDWIFVMHWPDGTNYPNHSKFIYISEPEVIIFDHIVDPKFQAIIQFEKIEDNKTRINRRMIFWSKELCDAIKVYAVKWNEDNFDRLEGIIQSVYIK